MAEPRPEARLDLDEWLPWIAPLTFPTTSLKLTNPDARLLLKAYEQRRDGLKPETDEELSGPLKALSDRLDGPVRAGGHGAFVRLSKRSGKDASNGDTRLPEVYMQERNAYCAEDPNVPLQVADVIAVARALATLLKVNNGAEAVLQLSSSQRIFTDLTMAILQQADEFSTEIHVRSFAPLLPEMEFRGFVCGGRLTAITQYLSICFVPRILREKDELVAAMQRFFTTEVQPRIPIKDYVVDFAFLRTGELRVIELNPFSRATHAALFDWEKDAAVLHGQKPFEVRIVTAFDPTCARRIARTILMRLAPVRADVPPPPEEKEPDAPQARASHAAKPPPPQEESHTCVIS